MSFTASNLAQSESEIARLSLRHLEAVVCVDSQSDEHSNTIPSTKGQERLAEQVAAFFEERGAKVERDPHANVIAMFDGRGKGREAAPLALMVHLDTARGTRAVDRLCVHEAWDGSAIPYPENATLQVAAKTYPAAAAFMGQDLVHGPGKAPFGLDDKLGLSHLMTLASLLESNPHISHPPLLLIGRPDEEIGRMAAVEGLARLLVERGVRYGYTVDGILPFEINVENFNASVVRVRFAERALETTRSTQAHIRVIRLGGVNTHGATAKAEGHRNATRLAVEITARLMAAGLAPRPYVPLRYCTDSYRECDGEWTLLLDAEPSEVERAEQVLTRTLEEVVGPHVPRGASWQVGPSEKLDPTANVQGTTLHALQFLESFMSSEPGFALLAEDSSGHQGYTHPYRMTPVDDGLQVEFRVRDFSDEGLEAREEHVRQLASKHGAAHVEVKRQYVNMGPRLQQHPELVEWAAQSGAALDIETSVQPIRGGTGVDPFLERGVMIANLGTGYFAPESEKEFTSLQMMARHAIWLTTLVQGVAEAQRGH